MISLNLSRKSGVVLFLKSIAGFNSEFNISERIFTPIGIDFNRKNRCHLACLQIWGMLIRQRTSNALRVAPKLETPLPTISKAVP